MVLGWRGPDAGRNGGDQRLTERREPEVGAHSWFDGDWRLTAFGRHVMTTEGHAYDDWLIGVQLARLAR